MNRQVKSIPYFEIKDGKQGRTRKGIAAVFGNIDSYGDRIMPGAFSKTIAEGRSRVKHLWNHSFAHPPIAAIKELREVGRDELPAAVLEYAPEATGGLFVAREYYKTDLADWVLQAIDTGDINEMSFGFDVVTSAEVTEDEKTIRELKEIKLFDTSDVLWGANAATAAAGAKAGQMPFGAIVCHLQAFCGEVKAGRQSVDELSELIDAAFIAVSELKGELADDVAPTVVKSDDVNTKADESDNAGEAGAALISTPLSANRLRLNELRLATLTI